jgi:uncharacterized protein (TIGR03437 family)
MKSFCRTTNSADSSAQPTRRDDRVDFPGDVLLFWRDDSHSSFSVLCRRKKKSVVRSVGLTTLIIFLLCLPFTQRRSSFAVGLPAAGKTVAKNVPTATSESNSSGSLGPRDQEKFLAAYARSPLSFESNQGQANSRTDFTAKGQGYSISLRPDEAVFMLRRPGTGFQNRTRENWAAPLARSRSQQTPTILTMKLIGANVESKGTGLEALAAKSNYFVGNDPSEWRTNVTQYSKVQYRDVYPGVSLVYYGNQRQLEYDFVLDPGADPQQIKMAFEGVQRLKIAENGELVIGVAGGEVRQHKPLLYQVVDGQRQEVAGRYVLLGKRNVGIAVDKFDRARPLTIDPVLVYSTYLGGNNDEYGNGIAADPSGNVYVTGVTYSADFPVKSALQTTLRGVGNVFVAKFNSSGGLVYSTYLGGSGEDVGFAIAVQSSGEIYITGSTDSSNFPVTSNTFQGQKHANIDAFVTKLNAAGNAIVYSTYVGGQGDDLGNNIAVESPGNVYVTGETTSPDFPMQNAFQKNLSGPSDAFVFKINASGNTLLYSTYLGGTGQDTAFGLAVDNQGSAYVTGLTLSTNFPTKNPVQAASGGQVDMFITKLNTSGNDLVYSTYISGANDEGGFGIGVNVPGNAYVSGFTTSTNFPTKSPFQAANGGGDDAVILKLDKDGKLVFSSYLGGAGEDRSFNLAVDNPGNAYLVGRTESLNFPLKNAIQTKIGGQQPFASPARENAGQYGVTARQNRDADRWNSAGGSDAAGTSSALSAAAVLRDAFVTKVDSDGKLVYSTYLGGSNEEKGFSIAVDNAGNAYITGLTASTDFPTKNPAQGTFRGGASDVFVTKISDVGNQTSVSAASYRGTTLTREAIVAVFGTGLANGTQFANITPLPTTLANVSIKLTDSTGKEFLAPLFFVSPSQINYLIPADVAIGDVTVMVINGTTIAGSEVIHIANVTPGIFSANANGQGVPAAVVLRVKADGAQSYEPLSRFDAATGQVVPVPIDLGGENDQVFLVLFATGVRYRSSLSTVTITVGGINVPALFAGPQGDFSGLDQVNLRLPRTLIGRGDVDVVLTVDGQVSNTVRINVK